jgi:hypothetical protein
VGSVFVAYSSAFSVKAVVKEEGGEMEAIRLVGGCCEPLMHGA